MIQLQYNQIIELIVDELHLQVPRNYGRGGGGGGGATNFLAE